MIISILLLSGLPPIAVDVLVPQPSRLTTGPPNPHRIEIDPKGGIIKRPDYYGFFGLLISIPFLGHVNLKSPTALFENFLFDIFFFSNSR
jgi:hypothetical protein